MQYSLHTNYQTSFRIQRKNDQTYFDAIHAIYDWLCTKEREASLREGWKEFSYRGIWDHCYRTNARIQTATCIEDDAKRAWAMEYNHVDRELGVKRFWHIHVGIRDTGDALVVAARVGYSWNSEDLTPESSPPSPSVPYFVRLLVQKFTAYSGRKEFRLIEKPLVLKNQGSGKLVGDFVFSPERKYPIIVFNGDSKPQLKEANRLAAELAGKAQIVVVGSDPALGRELKESFPWEFNIQYGAMRVFFPMGKGLPASRRHRWFEVGTDYYELQRDGIVHGLLRNHNLIEWESVETIADIQRLISKARIAKLMESTAGASEEEIQKLYQDYIKEVEIERDELKKESEDYAQQVDELEAAVQSLEWKCKSLESRPEQNQSAFQIREDLVSLPISLPEVVKLASKLHADRLIFAKEAFDSAEDSVACELVAEAWEILSHLATTLYDLKFNTESPGDLGRRFQEKSGYEYARTEGKQTKADSSLSRMRKIRHNEKDYEIWTHIKKGNEGNKMIRIHFDFDDDERKILIGYAGLHMDNASSRGRK